MAHATFYTVNGPRGEYYAVRNHETEKIWTERTESAARQQARDEHLELIASETIDHLHLLDMMIAVPFTLDPNVRGHPGDTPQVNLKLESGLGRFFRRLRGHAEWANKEGQSR